MKGIATPDTKQSEAYVSTAALFYIFSGNTREEKASLRLPPAWRDFFSELVESKKNHLDSQDRAVVKDIRTLVRDRRDQELEDGVILQGAFRGRGAGKNSTSPDSGSQDRSKPNNANTELFKKIWADKSASPKYQAMLVRALFLLYKRVHTDEYGRNPVLNCQCGASGTRFFAQSTRTRWSSSVVRQDGKYPLPLRRRLHPPVMVTDFGCLQW